MVRATHTKEGSLPSYERYAWRTLAPVSGIEPAVGVEMFTQGTDGPTSRTFPIISF